MTQFNHDKVINAEFEERKTHTAPHNTENRKRRSGNGLKNTVVIVALSLVCGAGGGIIATKAMNDGKQEVVVTTVQQPSPSNTTSVSSSTGLSISQAAQKAAPSVVEILAEGTTTTYGFFGGTYTSQSAGSGVIISDDGYIITNHHVVEDGESFTITTYDGTEYEASLIGSDAKSDIAVLKVEAEDLTPAVLGDSSTVQTGDTAIVIGNPLGTLGGTVTDGIISATSRTITVNDQAMELLQTNAQINSGNSGGGLFDGNGNLIGIVNAKDSGTTSTGTTIEGLGFAIPINTAFDIATQLIENGEVTNRATIGVYLQELTQSTGKYKAGLYITEVIKGSGAETAGLQAYDRIIEANGRKISSYEDLSASLLDKHVGDPFEMTVERDGQQIDVTVTLTGSVSSSN